MNIKQKETDLEEQFLKKSAMKNEEPIFCKPVSLRKELAEIPVVANFATTAADGKTYQVEHYSLDMILSVGYRVKSANGIKFRPPAKE